ncbi:MAG: hypothetical protein II207_03980, partial [Clostridia bacterium]|nr:hypothetical protein [Clostridia bacterium]
MACRQGPDRLVVASPAPHPENAHVVVDAGFRCLWHSRGHLHSRLFLRWRINPLAKRQEESHNDFDPLLQGLAQFSVGGSQPHFLGQLRHRSPQRL